VNRLREEVFRYYLMQLAGIVFQACSFNHSDISPLVESMTYERSGTDIAHAVDVSNDGLNHLCIQRFKAD